MLASVLPISLGGRVYCRLKQIQNGTRRVFGLLLSQPADAVDIRHSRFEKVLHFPKSRPETLRKIVFSQGDELQQRRRESVVDVACTDQCLHSDTKSIDCAEWHRELACFASLGSNRDFHSGRRNSPMLHPRTPVAVSFVTVLRPLF